jgi:DNA modification methylase
MVPEIALARLPNSAEGKHVLDPMMGSGTIPVLAGTSGHSASGFDIDPLAHLIALTWARPLTPDGFLEAGRDVAARARRSRLGCPSFVDDETGAFADRWFDARAQRKLFRLATEIKRQEPSLRPALWCAFSRLIITKNEGASLARDVSHSRPHRVRDVTDFDPIDRFVRTTEDVLRRHQRLGLRRPAARQIRLGIADARSLPLENGTVDCVITSPPYLIAIDYVRAHRMALIWMDFSVASLRELRGTAIGSQRGLTEVGDHEDLLNSLLGKAAPPRIRGVLRRYVTDLDRVLEELHRVVKPAGSVTLVVADATLFGFRVRISRLVDTLATQVGFQRVERTSRKLRESRRYLPPPSKSLGDLGRRVRTEIVLGYVR